MSGKREDVRAVITDARRQWPIGTLMAHKKGGIYIVVGHGFDTERGEANIHYRRRAGPGYDAVLETGLTYDRPLSLFTEDRFREIK